MRLRIAMPMSLSGTADIVLQREMGANVLVIARDSSGVSELTAQLDPNVGPAQSILLSVVASARCAHARVTVVDFTPADETITGSLGRLLIDGRDRLLRRSALTTVLSEICAEIDRRGDESRSAERMLLVLYGIHRARDFDTESMDFDASSEGPPELLLRILRDGPEVGIHTVAWSESVGATTRRLTREALREFSWRIAGRMGAEDSRSFVDSDGASNLRSHQILITNDDLGITRRCIAYGPPSDEWIDELLKAE